MVLLTYPFGFAPRGMVFIPKSLRLLTPAEAVDVSDASGAVTADHRATVAAEGLRMAMNYAGWRRESKHLVLRISVVFLVVIFSLFFGYFFLGFWKVNPRTPNADRFCLNISQQT